MKDCYDAVMREISEKLRNYIDVTLPKKGFNQTVTGEIKDACLRLDTALRLRFEYNCRYPHEVEPLAASNSYTIIYQVPFNGFGRLDRENIYAARRGGYSPLIATKAVHPRIVIDNFVAETVIENILQVKYRRATQNPQYIPFTGMGLMPQMPETGDGIVEKDIDGRYTFNYLHLPENNMVSPDCYSSCKAFLEDLIQYCHEQIGKNEAYRIIDKYYYLLRFSQSKLDNLLETPAQ